MKYAVLSFLFTMFRKAFQMVTVVLTKSIWFGGFVNNLTKNFLKKDTEILYISCRCYDGNRWDFIMEEQISRVDVIQEIQFVICRLMINEESHLFNHTEHVLSNKLLSY